MSRSVPELDVVDVGRDNLLETTVTVLATDEFNQSIINVGSMWEEEARSGAEFVEEEELLLSTKFAVVVFGCFFLEFLPFLQLLVVWKRDA